VKILEESYNLTQVSIFGVWHHLFQEEECCSVTTAAVPCTKNRLFHLSGQTLSKI